MNQQTKNCQNCKTDFIIEPEDFQFYDKMKVPPPTFCPSCRFQRRVMFRNERVLYKRSCGLCKKNIISIFDPDKPYIVYCNTCWWGDKWEATEFGMLYDSNRNFFEQFRDLQQKVPYMNLIVSYTTLINSDYVNHVGNAKNCYLMFDTDIAENVHYSTIANESKDSMDLLLVENSELCYEDINCQKCFNTFFSEDCNDCHNVYFSKSCSGCNDCVGCINLKNKRYYIFNEPYSKEEYFNKLKELKLNSHESITQLRKRVYEFWEKYPHRSFHGTHNVNVSGDYVYESKNGSNLYICRGVEDGKYCQRVSMKSAKDVYDYFEWGMGVEKIYECITVGDNSNNVKFSSACWSSTTLNVEYSMYCPSNSDLFGCIGLRKKQYCILNKQYDKETYQKLREEIIRNMKDNPYIDSKGREWRYGEFFPYDLSLFDYNESTATQYFPLEKEEIEKFGWRFKKEKKSEHEVTLSPDQMSDSIDNIQESILKEILECATCKKAFRLTPNELSLLKKFSFPVPRICSECRHKRRMARMNPPKFWDRKCAKCNKAIQTSYSPERKEIVYCEKCYQAEVI